MKLLYVSLVPQKPCNSKNKYLPQNQRNSQQEGWFDCVTLKQIQNDLKVSIVKLNFCLTYVHKHELCNQRFSKRV